MTTDAQVSAALFTAQLICSFVFVQNLYPSYSPRSRKKPQASFCGFAFWFVSDLVGSLEDMLSDTNDHRDILLDIAEG